MVWQTACHAPSSRDHVVRVLKVSRERTGVTQNETCAVAGRQRSRLSAGSGQVRLETVGPLKVCAVGSMTRRLLGEVVGVRVTR